MNICYNIYVVIREHTLKTERVHKIMAKVNKLSEGASKTLEMLKEVGTATALRIKRKRFRKPKLQRI